MKKVFISLIMLNIFIISIFLYNTFSITKRLYNLENYITLLEQKIERINLNAVEENANNSINIDNTINSNSTIYFDNPSIDNLSIISEGTAKEIWKTYLNEKQKITNYQIISINIELKKPNNFLDIDSIETYGYQMADFTRKCYVIVCKLNDENEQIEGHIDAYTGKVVGGYFFGI